MIINLLPDNKRLHLQHGPIDLVIEAFGSQEEITKAYRCAAERFHTILDELVGELPLLRTQIKPDTSRPVGTIAKTMYATAKAHAAEFITPMIAVAGAVADEVLSSMCQGAVLDKAYVNNGGDIALYLKPEADETFRTGIVSDPRTAEMLSTATINPAMGIAGIATSGRHGRSLSLGIADSVTVFAANAATADAAATIIANKIDLPDNPKVTRQPASQLSPDSDLGELLVTIDVAQLSPQEKATALEAGRERAQQLCRAGVIEAAFLSLQGKVRIIDWAIDAPAVFAPHSNLSTIENRIAHA